MHLSAKKGISTREMVYLFLILIMSFGIQIAVVSLISKYALILLIFFILFLFSVILYFEFLKDFSVYLLIVNFFPLLLLDNNLHYDFHLEMISFIPLFGLTLFAVCLYLLNERDLSIKMSYLELPVISLVTYFGLSALIAITKGRDNYWILIEFTHFFLYMLVFPILYLLKHRNKYLSVLKFLLVLSIIISLQYIVFDLLIFRGRFVTFQSGFLPLTIGVMFAYFLLNKDKKLASFIILSILIIGTFVTLTRTLWVVTFLVMLSVYLIYLKYNNKLTVFKTSFLILILIFPVIISGDSVKKIQTKALVNQSVKARAESLSNPLDDSSFLMRVELGYYAVEDFLKHPILGDGLASYVKYKIMVFNRLPVYYIDSSWLYMLWKGGIIGFALFVWLFVRFFKSAFYVLKNSSDFNARIISLGLIGGFIGLSFLGIFSPLLIKYKTNALIAILFAYIEFERRSALNKDTKILKEKALD